MLRHVLYKKGIVNIYLKCDFGGQKGGRNHIIIHCDLKQSPFKNLGNTRISC